MGAPENSWHRALELVRSLGRADAAARPEPSLPTDEALLALASGVMVGPSDETQVNSEAVADLRAAYNEGRQPYRILLNRVVEELLRIGVPAFIGASATLYAGKYGTTGLDPSGGHLVQAGPGRFDGPDNTVPVADRAEFKVSINDAGAPPSPTLPAFATVAEYARIIADLVEVAKARVNRIAAAQEAARDAFWAALADQFPEVDSGDFGPGETLALEEATNEAVRTWLYYNVSRETGLAAPRPAADFEPRYVLTDNQQRVAYAVAENGVDLACAEVFGGHPDWRLASLAAPVGLDDQQWAWCGYVRDRLKDVDGHPNPFDA